MQNLLKQDSPLSVVPFHIPTVPNKMPKYITNVDPSSIKQNQTPQDSIIRGSELHQLLYDRKEREKIRLQGLSPSDPNYV